MAFYLNHFAQIWLLPPGNVILLTLLGCLLWQFKPTLAKILISTSITILWLLSTPIIAQQLIDKLQYQYPNLASHTFNNENNTAIVVLEAGLNLRAPEYGEPTVSEITLSRLRYAAFLHQKTNIPILVSGYDPSNPTVNQTDYMANALKDYFNVPTKWKEDRGYNTAQEAIYSAEILKKSGVTKIYLVTHALHMPRSMRAFQNKGLEVIPAPTGYIQLDYNLGIISTVLPTSFALHISFAALREYIGMLWYRLYYRF